MSSAQYPLTINKKATLYEKDIDDLLHLFNFSVESSYSNFSYYKINLLRRINYININNSQQYESDKVKISIFNIYDNNNILNSEYGSTYNEFLETAYTFNDLMIKNNIKVPLYYHSEDETVIDNMAVLNFFLNTKTNFDTLIISLGSLNHATCLVLRKIEGTNFTKVIHVNTGLGLKSSKIEHDDKTFHNLFENAIYLTPELHNAFILFLKPFFFFKKFKKEDENSAYAYTMYVISNYSEELLDLHISDEDKQKMFIFYNLEFKDIHEYYIHIYTKLYLNSDYTFEYLNDIFNLNNFLKRLNYVETNLHLINNIDYTIKLTIEVINKYERRINENSNIFYQYFILNKKLMIDTSKQTDLKSVNYLNKALNNIDLYYNNILYITSQSAGTCVFKSLLVSIFYHLIDFKPELITDIYLDFSSKCYNDLSTYFSNPDTIKKSLFNEFINTSKICMQLIKDDIIDKDFSPNKMIINNYKNLLNESDIGYSIVDYSSAIYTNNLKVSTIPISDLNNLLNNIRNIKATEYDINILINKYLKNTDYHDISRTYGELILIGFIWELYFNNKWEPIMNNFKYHYTNLIYLNLLLETKSRIDFTTNEINWICKSVFYFMFNYEKLQECTILPKILDYDKLTTFIKTVRDDYNQESTTQIMSLFQGLEHLRFNTLSDNYYIYNKEDSKKDDFYDSKNKSKPDIQRFIVLYLDYLFAKNENQYDSYLSNSYLLDFDISNINRFFINYFKNTNNYYIELEYVFKILYESKTTSDLYLSNVVYYNERVNNIKNIYIFNSLIHIYILYYTYLTQDEKYKFLKQIFINFKSVLKFPIIHMIYLLLNSLLYSLNTIFDDIYLDIIITEGAEYMNYSTIDGYNHVIFHKSNLYNINGSDKTTYNIIDYQFSIFLYENILTLFENNKTIDKSEIDKIIQFYKYKIDSPYFKYNPTDKTKMDLIINNKVITSTFYEITDFQTQSYSESIFLLGDLLLNNNKNKCYIDKNKTYLVFVLKETNYRMTLSIMPHDVIIVFEIRQGEHIQDCFQLTENIYINSHNAILDTNNNKYPFMAHASPCTINIIESNNNNFTVHCIANSLSKHELSSYTYYSFHKIIIDKYDNYYTSFQIKPNYLTAYSNLNKLKYLKQFYKIFTPYQKYVETWITSRTDIDYAKIIRLKNLTSLDKLTDYATLKIISERVQKISDAILNDARGNYIDLVNWINNNTDNINKDTIVPYNGDFKCNLKCVKIQAEPFKEQINTILNSLQVLLEASNKGINHNYSTYFEFLYYNYDQCYAIMIINIYISSLNRLLKVIDTCEPILCHELLEINQIFEKRYKNDNISILSGIVEIVFGNLLKNEQWGKIYSIYDNYNNRATQKWEVHQFMMGKGKSSIITPMLITMLYYNKSTNIYLIVPEHLKQQTRDTLAEYRNFFNMTISILTDTEIKILFLEKPSFENSIVLIDEFDYMYNPVQSNFNKIEYANQINLNLIDMVFNIVHRIIHFNKPFTNINQFKGINEITNILNDSNNIKNVSYGMSIYKKYRYCIPYLRKDSPNEGSKFSSILLTIVLTILYFYNKEHKKYILEEKDIRLAFSDKKLFNKLRKLYNIEDEDLEDFLYKFKLINIKDIPVIPENIMKQYFKIVFLNFKKSEIVMNCSFIDIINAESLWQVGYSGTVNINMDIEPLNDIIKYNKQIIIDNDENINVMSALTYHDDVLQIDNIDKMFDVFVENNYNVLIDECALLKDYDNNKVAEILFTKILNKHKIKKIIIYLLSDDTKMIYNGNHHIYEEKMYNRDEVVYYYSQRHIVGIDFKQPTILTGLVLLNSNSIYTNVSQAIFRMRKLNKGHSIRIGYFKTSTGQSITLSSRIYELLNINEQALNYQNKLLLIYQYLKFYVRKYYTKHYYEVDLEMFKDEPTKQTIYDKIKYNVFSIELKNKPWIKWHVKDNYKTFKQAPNDTKVKALLNMLLNNNLNDLLKLVFNTNSIQKEVSSEVQTITESQVVVQKQSIVLDNTSLLNMFKRIVVRFNPFYTDYPIEYFGDFTYNKITFDNGYTLLFSFNLFHNISKCDSAIIIQLSDKVYLLDHISMINHYVYMCRIYNLNGRCINNFIFKDKPFINFSSIFNYTLVYNNKEFNIGYVLFNIDNEEIPTTKQNTNILTINKLLLLISVSNINIFKRDDLYIQEIKSTYDFNNLDIIYPSDYLIHELSKYTEDFYKKISNNYNISSNNLISIKKNDKQKVIINVETQHTLFFTFDNEYETNFYTIAA